MSETTNLKLFKHNKPLETNENQFDIDLALNQNWDKIDNFAGKVDDKVIEIEENIDEQILRIEQQNELISKLKNALINIETEQSKSIYIKNASEVPAQLKVEGNQEQETQEGTDNLAVLEEGTITQNGLTVTVASGEVTISGTNTADSITSIEIGKAYLYAGQTYYQIKTSAQSGFGARIQSSTGVQHWFDNTESSFACETTEEWSIFVSVGANQTVNATLKLMISKESGTEWVEGKVAIPSPPYSSSVKCLGSNKNYFNKDTVTQNKYLNGYAQTVEYGDLFDSTSSNTTDYIKIFKDKTYTFSFDFETLLNANERGYIFYNEDKAIIKYDFDTIYNVTSKVLTFTAKQNGYVRITYDKNCTNIKFEEGDTATSYSPYRTR